MIGIVKTRSELPQTQPARPSTAIDGHRYINMHRYYQNRRHPPPPPPPPTMQGQQPATNNSIHTVHTYALYSPTEQARPIRHRLDHHRALRQSPHHWTPTFHQQNNQTMMRGLPPMQPKDLPPEQQEPSQTKAAGPVPPRRAARSVSGRALAGTTSVVGGTSSSRSIVSRIS